MDQSVIDIIYNEYHQLEHQEVKQTLETLGLEHVMANSEANLNNAIHAILKLAKGNMTEIRRLTECAKIDFRDVIYWASLENK
ncbi:hypothetical protein [Spongiivirga citrea]|uniref:Uncharacterized protein n=1 Tax=Spongiivirga citrea TaxID=1481457 RepID=A0A6M0CFS6_9FLAO|nr:hypothetical protein [Spongiivirga citrea]NER16671.1 hypothetical protein [Spongiivirga citrea]